MRTVLRNYFRTDTEQLFLENLDGCSESNLFSLLFYKQNITPSKKGDLSLFFGAKRHKKKTTFYFYEHNQALLSIVYGILSQGF